MIYLPKARNEKIVVQSLKDEVLVYDLTLNRVLYLNKTSAAVWQLCNGDNSIGQIRLLLEEQVNSSVAEDLIWLALGQLKKENLLSDPPSAFQDFPDLDRRQVIRKIGIVSMIALSVPKPISIFYREGSQISQ